MQSQAADPFALVRPAYGTGSLAELLPSVLAVLGVPGAVDRLALAAQLTGVRRVVVLLIDGLGYQLLPLAAPSAPVLAAVLRGELGELRALTATFPSTTPTSLASLGTGAVPGAHGLVGFTVRVPGTGRVLNHIAWDTEPDPLWWQPLPTQFSRAAEAGVAASVVSRGEYAGSGLTRSAWRGGRYLPADDIDSLAHHLLVAVREPAAPVLALGYHPDVDRLGHLYGVGSPPWRESLVEVDRLIARLVEGLPPDAALLVTADHGQLDVPAGHRFDLATDARLTAGVELVTGEPRVRYLHTAPGASADVLAAWREILGPAAWVASREEAVAEGWFGPVAEAHLSRVGDVVAVCRDRYAVLSTSTEPPQVARLVAFHGGWTAVEMLVPLLVLRPGVGAPG